MPNAQQIKQKTVVSRVEQIGKENQTAEREEIVFCLTQIIYEWMVDISAGFLGPTQVTRMKKLSSMKDGKRWKINCARIADTNKIMRTL